MRDSAITLIAVFWSYGALDDITTDNATSFPLERTFLILAACWFVAVAWRIVRSGNRAIGFLSISVAVAAAAAGLSLVRGSALTGLECLVSYVGLVWFTGVAGTLLWRAWRARRLA